MIDCDASIDTRVRGESVRRIARQFGVTIDDVHDIVDR
jgi:hypothetical protein